jgi:hypothetical protein
VPPPASTDDPAGAGGPRTTPDESDAAPASHLRVGQRRLGSGPVGSRRRAAGAGGTTCVRASDRRAWGRPCEARQDERGNGRAEAIKKQRRSSCCSLFSVRVWMDGDSPPEPPPAAVIRIARARRLSSTAAIAAQLLLLLVGGKLRGWCSG